MTHHQLGFQSSYGFERNAYDDEDRSTAHRDVELWYRKIEKYREYSDDSEEDRTDKSYL